MHLPLFFVGALLIIMANGSPLREDHDQIECHHDMDCPKNFFCYNESKLCAECNKDFCSLRNRRNSFRLCHKEPEECEECLPGYEEEIYADGSKRGACILSLQVKAPYHSAETTEPELSNYALPFFIGALACLTVFAISGLIYRTVRNTRSANNSFDEGSVQEMQELCQPPEEIPLNHSNKPIASEEYNSPPPPYSLECSPVPSAPQLDTEELFHVFETNGFQTENLVQAVPFKAPDVELDDSQENLSAQEDTNEGQDDSFLNDETTQPSTWTPQCSTSNLDGSSEMRQTLKRPLLEAEADTKKIKVEEDDTEDLPSTQSSERPFRQFGKKE